MKKKHTAQSGSFNLQLVLCAAAVCSMITGTLLAFFHPEAPAKASHPAGAGLTFAERVAYQRAIEDVYWRHRIWPKERPDPKPSLDAVMSQAQIERKSKIICATRRRWKITGNGRLRPSNCRLRWIAWRITPNSHRFYAKSFTRLAMIRPSSLSVWRDQC